MAKNKRQTPMGKLTQNYEKLIEGKETENKGKTLFDKAINKASKPRRLKQS